MSLKQIDIWEEKKYRIITLLIYKCFNCGNKILNIEMYNCILLSESWMNVLGKLLVFRGQKQAMSQLNLEGEQS